MANETATIADILHDLVNRPILQTLILIVITALIVFITVSSIAFIVSRLKGKVNVDFFSIFKIGNNVKEEKKETSNNVVVNVNTELKKEETEIEIETIEEVRPLSVLKEMGSSNSDLMMIISKSVIFGASIVQYREVYLIKMQMSMAEAKIDLIEGMLIKEYMEAIFRKKGYINIQDDQSYLIYVDIIHNQTHKSNLDVLRGAFKDNHLAEYDDEEYEDYIQMQSERQMNSMKISINGSVPSFLEPGREIINQIMDKKQDAILAIYREIFSEARFSALKIDAIIKNKEKEFDDEIKKLTGIKNAHKGTGLQT